MAEVVGFLRQDATFGEKETLKLLSRNLPKEYTVYVETPIRKKREMRYPDFIILTNYGVIVLEVKDWVFIEGADPHGATIRTRTNEVRREHNPVTTAREMAIDLSNQLKSRFGRDEPSIHVPWGYAAVMYNLSAQAINNVRVPWGEYFVIGQHDLENPDLLLNRLKQTMTAERMRDLTRHEMDQIRATIYPVVESVHPDRAPVILNEQQERIVAEPVHIVPEPVSKAKQKREQVHRLARLFEEFKPVEEEDALPPEGERISQNVSIRLVRGFSGSGKTLVLVQRARFLAAQYPEWKIGLFSFNKPLQEQFEQEFKGTNIRPRTFHSLCWRWLNLDKDSEASLEEWLIQQAQHHPIITRLGNHQSKNEINWLRDIGIDTLEDYLPADRKGIGRDVRLTAQDRTELFQVYTSYRQYLKENNLWDWHEVPLLTLQAMDQRGISENDLYDAILVDEAQDWAPIWFKIINRLIRPQTGFIFLADDPSQSIFRVFSWREKSIPVVGRTRWLRIPYRNTYEIYRAAYAIIADHAEIQKSLSEEGEVIVPEISQETMRHGAPPLIRKCRNVSEELLSIKNTVNILRSEGLPEKHIAVLARYQSQINPLRTALQGTNITVHMMHSFKGLEVEAVIIPHIHCTFQHSEDEAGERRLLYMAMSRARSRLYMTCSSSLPQPFENLRKQQLVEII